MKKTGEVLRWGKSRKGLFGSRLILETNYETESEYITECEVIAEVYRIALGWVAESHNKRRFFESKARAQSWAFKLATGW